MNLVQTNLLREVAAEVKAHGGALQFKSHALKNLELRTVLKESHGSPIVDLVFNSLDPEHRNLFASIGGDQVTIYDDEHMGDFMGVVVHYVNSPTAHHRGGDVTCCAWVQMSGITRHELGDACLAVSGPEGVIQLISVVEARVTALLRGHRGEVAELRGCAGVPGLLLSLGVDGALRLWDVAAEGGGAGRSCLAEVASDAVTLEAHPEGRCFFTGHRGGRICRWDLNLDLHSEANGDTKSGSAPAAGGCGGRRLVLRGGAPPAPQQLALPDSPLGEHLDCLRCISAPGPGPCGERLAAKSLDGRMAVWELVGAGGAGSNDAASGAQQQQLQARLVLSLRVPGTHPASGAGSGAAAALRAGRCRFSVTRDGAFICVGNPAGDVYVYDTSSGGRTAHYSAHKMRGPARAAALSEDGRHLLTVHGNGYILRYEYIRKQQQKQKQTREGGGAVAADEGRAAGSAAQGESAEAGPGAGPDEAREGGVTVNSREVSPEAGREDDISAAVEPGAADGGIGLSRPLAKRPRPENGGGEASPSCGASSGSGEDGGGTAAAAYWRGRRLKLRIRLGAAGAGMREGRGVGGREVSGGGVGAGVSGSGAAAVVLSGGTSPDAEWCGGGVEETDEQEV